MFVTEIFILLFLHFCSCVLVTKTPKQITKIPRYDGPLVWNQYSGYVTVNEEHGRNIFYVFVQSDNPADPVVLWLQGGPGCSGIMAYMTEHGPFSLQDDGTVIKNPFSLVSLGASVLYVDSPAGVGYGFCTDFQNFLTGSDNRTTDDLYIFLQEFFTNLFPTYRKNDLFIFGESYGGIYIPWISRRIDQENERGVDPQINLKGMMMSNAVMNFANYYQLQPLWLMAHAVISIEQYNKAYTDCEGKFYENMNIGNCKAAWSEIITYNQIGLNVLDLYSGCYGGIKHQPGSNDPMVNCINTETSHEYFNLPESLEDFGVSEEFKKTTKEWSMCSDIVQFQDNYTTVLTNVIPLVQDLYRSGKYKILIASGDVDMTVVTIANELDYAEIISPKPVSLQWDKWYSCDPISPYANKQIAGWYRQDNNLLLATIKGSGHMISTYKPMQSYLLYKSWLHNEFPQKQCIP